MCVQAILAYNDCHGKNELYVFRYSKELPTDKVLGISTENVFLIFKTIRSNIKDETFEF